MDRIDWLHCCRRFVLTAVQVGHGIDHKAIARPVRQRMLRLFFSQFLQKMKPTVAFIQKWDRTESAFQTVPRPEKHFTRDRSTRP